MSNMTLQARVWQVLRRWSWQDLRVLRRMNKRHLAHKGLSAGHAVPRTQHP